MQDDNQLLEASLFEGIQNYMQDSIQMLSNDIHELNRVHSERLEEEDISNKSYHVAQTIQQFLAQHKSVFLSKDHPSHVDHTHSNNNES